MNLSLEKFYEIIYRLKFAKRQGWKQKGLKSDTIAGHTFGSILLGWLLAHLEKADVYKTLELLTVHELVMAEMEDLTPASGMYDEKQEIEKVAMRKIANRIPRGLRRRYLNLFREYQKRGTKESMIAREAAKLETLLQGERFEIETNRENILNEFLMNYKKVFRTKSGRLLYKGIKERHIKRSRA